MALDWIVKFVSLIVANVHVRIFVVYTDRICGRCVIMWFLCICDM